MGPRWSDSCVHKGIISSQRGRMDIIPLMMVPSRKFSRGGAFILVMLMLVVLLFRRTGQWLVYRRNPVGEGGQLFVEPFPTTGTEFRLTQDGGSAPIWSRDGRELFYRRNVQSITGIEGGAQSPNLMAVDISLEGTPEWGNQRVLPIEGFLVFQGSVDYDITADGERFLMVFPEDQTDVSEPVRPQINIVLNWFEELKERVPVP